MRPLFTAPLLAVLCLSRVSAFDSVAGGIKGTVYDGDLPLSGTLLTLESPVLAGGAQQRASDERGDFKFAPLVAGTYTLRAQKAGFGQLTLATVVVEKWHDTAIAVEMQVGADRVIARPQVGVTREFWDHLTSVRSEPEVLATPAETPGSNPAP